MKFKKIPTYFFITFACCLWLSVTTMAQQTDNGTLAGTITDQQGAVIANATVTATSSDTGLKRTVTTNDEGRWTISALKLGNYEIKVEATGFQTTIQPNNVVTASTTTTVDIIVGISGGENVVDVTADDQSSAINQEQNAATVSTTSGKRLEEIPIIRGGFATVQLDTSSSSDLGNPSGNGNGNPETSINGGRTTSLGVIFNGIDATNISGTGTLTENFSPAPETVQEVKLFSSLYDASLGRNGGGSVQVVTRNGTNKFSGTAYIYAQNEKFNANDFFFNRDGIDRQRARKLEGGFTLGGPIIKEKLWFFGGYQKTDANTAYVPTASSFVVLPEALAFATDRSPQGLRRAFGLVRGDNAGQGFSNPNCITTARIPMIFSNTQLNALCIDPFGPGYKLFTARNPITGDFVIPTFTAGRYERVFVDPVNTTINPIGLPAGIDLNNLRNNLQLLDIVRESGIGGGNPLVRFRNVFPADFGQDQFTTRLDYNLLKGDAEGHNVNSLYGTFFFANFPASEPFTVDTLVSPFPLIKNDRNRTLALNDTHIFNGNMINEARFGYFYLNNSRSLDERLLTPELTNTGLGIFNPAKAFAPGAVTERCGRVSGRGNLQDFQVCAPNDIYNQRKQVTLTFADNFTYTHGDQIIRFGVEHKRNTFDTNFPEEQGGDFENLNNFSELLLGYIPEADTSFGITDKSFSFNDLSFYASDDWKVASRLTLNLGLRWDWFGLPIEKNGRFANFDPSLLTNPDDLRPGFLLPSNVKNTGVVAVDGSLPTINIAKNKHTLNGQDLNNFAPRVGFAWSPFKGDKTKISGGYGIFYDRPSGAFINTVYKNYPFFREIEEKNDLFNPFALQYDRTFAGRNPNTPFSQYLPFRIQWLRGIGVASPYQLFDSTPVTTVVNGTSYAGNRAEALEFRAVDRDLKTPLIQQWNLGIQQELGKGWVVESRYVGTRGQQLLLAVGFNQAYDLNDPSTPDYIFERLNRAYLTSDRANNFPLNPGSTARQRGCGIAFGNGLLSVVAPLAGFPYPFGPSCAAFNGSFDYNFDAYADPLNFGTDLIETELRVPYLGLDPVESIQLQSRGYSFYHAAQLNISKRFSKGIGFNASYTFSKSIDIGSTDPGSTAASGRPDTPSLGLVVQGDQRNLNSNRALSDFDRTHRFTTSFVFALPNFGSESKFLNGWQLSGIGQWQSGTPFTILASDVEFVPRNNSQFQDQLLGKFNLSEFRRLPGINGSVQVVRDFYNAGRASGTLYNAAFGRPNVRSLELLQQRNCSDLTRCYFNTRQNPNDPEAALLPAYGRFGNLGRNILRGPSQKRIDLSLQKTTKLFSERVELELKWDIFNVFNFVNFANPNADLSDETDFGQITNTVGAPRVMQFGAKLRF